MIFDLKIKDIIDILLVAVILYNGTAWAYFK
jgi:hypothetical protein